MEHLLSFDDHLARSLNRIDELLESAQEEADELEALLTPSEQKLARMDPKVLWARFHAADSLVRALLDLRHQTAAILDLDSQTAA